MANIIDPESAKALVHEYRQQNAASNGPNLRTPENKHLNGFFIDRASLLAILSNPDADGVSICFAKDPDFIGSRENVFTLVYTGAKENTSSNEGAPYESCGDIYCGTPPCPPYCCEWGW
jgi:hypothetical protein